MASASAGKLRRAAMRSPRRAARSAPGALRSFSEQAYRRLEEMIITLQLRPGATVTEMELMERTGFGRTPIREALLRLADDDLVTIMPRRGIVVTEINVRDQLLLLEVRRELERLIARRAARRSTPEQRRRFQKMAASMREAAANNDHLLFLRVDNDYNQFIAECSGNRFAVKAISSIHALSRRFWYMHYRSHDVPTAPLLHADVMEAVAAGDEEAAGRASDALLDYVEAFTRATLDA